MKAKTFTFLLFTLIVSTTITAQTPNYIWAKNEGGALGDGAWSVASDMAGNIIVTGFFYSPTITFGSTTLTNADSSGNNPDVFIVKYDGNGNVLWAKQAGGPDLDWGTSIAIDASNNIIITGKFESPSITFGSTTLANADNSGLKPDIFIVKYDTGGNVLWAQRAGGTSWDDGSSLALDSAGNIIIEGIFYNSTITFGSTTLVNADPSANSSDIFVVKYDTNGNILWAKREGGTLNDIANGITADASGNIILTGQFRSPTITLGTNTFTNAGNDDVFILKYDSSGNRLWSKHAGGSLNENGSSVTTDNGGNIFVSGIFESSSLSFGINTLTNANSGTNDIFILKYDTNGNDIWAKREGGNAWDGDSKIRIDAGGNIIMAGNFESPSINLGSTTLVNANSSGNTSDILILKYDTNGNLVWAQRAGGSSGDAGNNLTMDPGGNIIITGWFSSSSINFGTTTLSNSTIGWNDIFTVKIDELTGIENNDLVNSTTIYPNPFSTQTIVKTSLTLNNATLKMTDYLGRTVAEINNINGQTIIINRNELASGVYFFWLTENDQPIASNKLVIADK